MTLIVAAVRISFVPLVAGTNDMVVVKVPVQKIVVVVILTSV